MYRKAWLISLSLMIVMYAFAQRPSGSASLTTPMKMGRADTNTFVGLISDSRCSARHKLENKSAEECTRTCQRAGSGYVLVAGEQTFRLKGETNDVAVLAGQKAKVTGTLQGDTITVSAVRPTL